MIIDLKNIPVEGKKLSFSEPADIFEIKDEVVLFKNPVFANVYVQVVDKIVLVSGSLETTVVLECSLCLKKFEAKIDVDNFSFDCEYPEDDLIDLTEPVREDIIVRLSLNPICEKSCKGLCSICGIDLNISDCTCAEDKQKEIATKDKQGNIFDNLNFIDGKISEKE